MDDLIRIDGHTRADHDLKWESNLSFLTWVDWYLRFSSSSGWQHVWRAAEPREGVKSSKWKPRRSAQLSAFTLPMKENPRKHMMRCGAAHLGKVRLFRADETAAPSKRESRGRYAALRLEGECLIVAEAAPSEVPAIVHHLQSAGSPAVFVVSEALSDLAVPEVRPASAGNEPIEDFARRCAERRGKPGTAKPRILSRLRENELILEASCRDLTEAANLEHALTAAAEWLLDNGYLIRTQIAEIRRHLPREHHRILPG